MTLIRCDVILPRTSTDGSIVYQYIRPRKRETMYTCSTNLSTLIIGAAGCPQENQTRSWETAVENRRRRSHHSYRTVDRRASHAELQPGAHLACSGADEDKDPSTASAHKISALPAAEGNKNAGALSRQERSAFDSAARADSPTAPVLCRMSPSRRVANQVSSLNRSKDKMMTRDAAAPENSTRRRAEKLRECTEIYCWRKMRCNLSHPDYGDNVFECSEGDEIVTRVSGPVAVISDPASKLVLATRPLSVAFPSVTTRT